MNSNQIMLIFMFWSALAWAIFTKPGKPLALAMGMLL